MAKHSKGVIKGEFCAIRKKACDHAEYRKNCQPAPTGWATFSFIRGRKKRKEKVFEAHHLLCVASVTQHIANGRGIANIVKQTDWCVNMKPNMFAMPLWGHTIKHYCNIEDARLRIDSRIKSGVRAPKFKNVPQHDYDHNSKKGYKSEVTKDLKKLARQVREGSNKKHEVRVKELKSELKSLSRQYRTTLQDRGSTRSGGTHAAWKAGQKDPEGDWYLPFSMADDGAAEARIFPTGDFNSKTANKIKKLVASFKLS